MSESLPVYGPGEGEPVSAGDLMVLRKSARLIAAAFDAWASKDWGACDVLLAAGVEECGEIFTFLAEHVVSSPTWRSRVDSPAWQPFLEYLAFMALGVEPSPEPSPPAPRQAPPPPPPPERPPPWERKPDLPGLARPGALSESMRKMGLM